MSDSLGFGHTRARDRLRCLAGSPSTADAIIGVFWKKTLVPEVATQSWNGRVRIFQKFRMIYDGAVVPCAVVAKVRLDTIFLILIFSSRNEKVVQCEREANE